MKKIFNDNIAISPVNQVRGENSTFVLPENDSERPSMGKVEMIGDLVTKVGPGDVIGFNPGAAIGPFEFNDKEIWLISEKQIHYQV